MGATVTAGWPASDRGLFDIPDGVVYLNTASIGPRLHTVTRAGEAALERFATPWEIRPADWFEGAEAVRGLFADLVGGRPDCVALVPAVSYGIALAARNVPVRAGSTVVILEDQYPANVYAWRRVCAERGATVRYAGRSPSRSLTDAVLRLVDERTAVVAVPNCHWTDGAWVDLERIGAAAREAGAALVVDASQSLGALPLDVGRVRPDFLVSVGYKWQLGPYGLAYAYVDERWHEDGAPLEESWLTREGSEDFSGLVDYVDRYRSGARRFDGGEFPQFISMPMARAALSQLLAWGVDEIQAALSGITLRIERRASDLGLDVEETQGRVGHMLGLGLPRGVPERLGDELRRRGIHLAIRGDKLRVAPHLHTTERDVELLVEALTACL